MTEIEVEFIPKTKAQAQAYESTAPNLLCSGPWGGGKTHVGAAKGFRVGMMYKNNCIALVRKKRVDLEATLWKWFIDKILPPEVVVAKNDTKLYRKVRNGTEFHGVGLDSDKDVNKLASREYGMIIVEEARELKEDDFVEKLQRCLRLPTVNFHQLMLMTNPDAPAHFLYRLFYLDAQPGYEKIDMEMLPDLPKSYMDRVNALTGIHELRYKKGKWASAEGLVYPFDPTKHILTKEKFKKKTGLDEIPKDWKRVFAVDFGFDHPFVGKWYAISPDEIWFMYREIYMSNRTINTHAPQILRYFRQDGIAPEAICDHDAQAAATLKEHGIKTRPALKDRLAGQATVHDLIANDKFFYMADALVEQDQRLVMEKRPWKSSMEFGSYIWQNKTKEDMVKDKDDGMDTDRYATHTTLKKPKAKAKAWILD